MLLTGCDRAAPPVVKKEIPASLTTCAKPKPYPPAAVSSQADMADMLTDTYGAWEDCAGKLSRLPEVMRKACGG